MTRGGFAAIGRCIGLIYKKTLNPYPQFLLLRFVIWSFAGIFHFSSDFYRKVEPEKLTAGE